MNRMGIVAARHGLQIGAVAFVLLTYLTLIGLPGRLADLAMPVLAGVTAIFFWLVLRRSPQRDGIYGALGMTGLWAGLSAGGFYALLTTFFAGLLANGVRVQLVFDKIVPQNMAALYAVMPGALVSGELSPMGWLRQVGLLGLSGLAAVLLVAGERWLRRQQFPSLAAALRWLPLLLPFVLLAAVIGLGSPAVTFGGNNQGTIRLLLAMLAVGSGIFAARVARPGSERRVLWALLGAGLVGLPFLLDQFQNSVMGIVFIFVMMGLGLNIVVGFAGLLDLGYVAFFAIGAYVYAFLAAPFSSPWLFALLQGWGLPVNGPLASFWLALPLTMVAAGLGGVLLGIPVLRLRGDYLAIVTLGFGEIIRLFMLNLSELTNGPRGLLNIAPPMVGGYSLGNPRDIFLLALAGAALIALVANRLDGSRLGRAWVAMREDEDVAQATGIHLVYTKLMAFAIGALFAGLAGQLYAARQTNIFPENFSLFVSIDALSLVIVGGMGSIPGVVLGALALKGLPEVLRGVDEYRIITFAALLVIMMIVRPQGILPSLRRGRELQERSASQADLPSVLETSPGGGSTGERPLAQKER